MAAPRTLLGHLLGRLLSRGLCSEFLLFPLPGSGSLPFAGGGGRRSRGASRALGAILVVKAVRVAIKKRQTSGNRVAIR
jgi:hypothetical protein